MGTGVLFLAKIRTYVWLYLPIFSYFKNIPIKFLLIMHKKKPFAYAKGLGLELVILSFMLFSSKKEAITKKDNFSFLGCPIGENKKKRLKASF